MNREDYNDLLTQPKNLRPHDLKGLNQLVEKYPYFQSAHALRLKVLKNTGALGYNQALKLTASVTTDRDVLFDYITSEDFLQQTNSETIIGHQEHVKAIDVELEPQESLPHEQQPTKVDSKTPFDFDQNEKHSFEQWLKITSAKVIDRGTDSPNINSGMGGAKDEKNIHKWKKIDKFLAQKTSLKPADNSSGFNRAESFLQPKEELMTETLARVYIQQKNYEKAIEAYKILILKYPEKSSFFANQIRDLKRLLNV